MVADEIHKDIQQSVRTPAYGIAESLQRHQLAEGRIEKINEICEKSFHHKSPLPLGAKINTNTLELAIL
jgi:hypothetical protein